MYVDTIEVQVKGEDLIVYNFQTLYKVSYRCNEKIYLTYVQDKPIQISYSARHDKLQFLGSATYKQ